jgi:hypothetical protein
MGSGKKNKLGLIATSDLALKTVTHKTLFDGANIRKLLRTQKFFYRTYDNFEHYCVTFPEDFHKKQKKTRKITC